MSVGRASVLTAAPHFEPKLITACVLVTILASQGIVVVNLRMMTFNPIQIRSHLSMRHLVLGSGMSKKVIGRVSFCPFIGKITV